MALQTVCSGIDAINAISGCGKAYYIVYKHQVSERNKRLDVYIYMYMYSMVIEMCVQVVYWHSF